MFDKKKAVVSPTKATTQPTLDELLAAKAKLDEEIYKRGQAEIEHEVQKMKALASTLGVSLANLFGITPTVVEQRERKKRQVKLKYADDQGNTWTGRGRPPSWLSAQLEEGKTKEDFLIQ